MITSPIAAVLFGRPGSGKGTLASILAQDAYGAHLSMGEEMRRWSTGESPEQRALASDLALGKYGSDDLAATIAARFLHRVPVTTRFVILDGFPRNLAQFEAWREMGIRSLAILVDASEDVCRARLARRVTCPRCGVPDKWPASICTACGEILVHRTDDGETATMDRRFATYDRVVVPVISRWQETGLPLHVIDMNKDRSAEYLRAKARQIFLSGKIT